MLIAALAIIAGFTLLIWSADHFVRGAAALARNFGVPPLIIGLTIVGMGTSAPELLVSSMASWGGNGSLSIGNAIGSNITNIGLVLGTTVLIKPLTIHSHLLRRELPLLLIVMLFGYGLLADGWLARTEGGMLLLGLIVLLTWLIWSAYRSRQQDALTIEIIEEQPDPVSTPLAFGWFILGLMILMGGARLLVWGAVDLARLLGISDLTIGLTIVAIGTSLPELATSILSARRGEPDLAFGNIIGSNLFNILGVLGVSGLIAPCRVPQDALMRDYPLMLLLTTLLFIFGYGHRKRRINRTDGGILLGIFVGYEYWLYWTA